ncbi:GAF domain-containing protein [Mycolicibacterium boenickei]|uniref:GAF domain-containing protein n=1 Tax=Mycolicibacterium boenickei TaxID=146017 RepID=A0AAX2ZQH9_9MYCO|nr:GAF domain-containing protein [Mycolicibacterium boenickei]PEG58503.1 GAF domain-containing protein [Mycolicibacterium boenickei]UNB97421.1 GAF domain-containing protein [Mycolicibacterium boenickei]BBX93105.1 hypothetical protein MBOE_47540 [Mycolicibacterium boenickei]
MAVKWGTLSRFILTVVAIVGVPTCTLFVKRADGTYDWRWFGGQIFFVLLAAGVPAYAAWRRKRTEISDLTRSRLHLSFTLNPVLRRIVRRTVEDPAALRNEIRAIVVRAAADIVGPGLMTRSCYFELVEVTAQPAQAAPLKQLVLEEQAGRADPVLSEFTSATPRGADAIKLVMTDGQVRCRDVIKEPLPHWADDGDQTYKTFISVAVVGHGTAYGMLTVDAPKAGDLDKRDVYLLRAMAGLIAVANTIAQVVPGAGQQ